ncbi:MAG TPA: glycosyltransferase, partial [Ktedonobacteraceae bacterium]|nr:glycosyltransferase [Ktedonobacteraceae bacterium]
MSTSFEEQLTPDSGVQIEQDKDRSAPRQAMANGNGHVNGKGHVSGENENGKQPADSAETPWPGKNSVVVPRRPTATAPRVAGTSIPRRPTTAPRVTGAPSSSTPRKPTEKNPAVSSVPAASAHPMPGASVPHRPTTAPRVEGANVPHRPGAKRLSALDATMPPVTNAPVLHRPTSMNAALPTMPTLKSASPPAPRRPFPAAAMAQASPASPVVPAQPVMPETPVPGFPREQALHRPVIQTFVPETPVPGVLDAPARQKPTPARPGAPKASPYSQSAIIDPHIRERVKFYYNWLAKQAKYETENDNSKEVNAYIEEATKIVKVGKQEVAIFAPYRPKLSALQTFTTRQVVAISLIALLWVVGLLVFRLKLLTGVIGAITAVYFLNLLIDASVALRAFRNAPEEHIGDDIVHALRDAEWPMYTILCPLYREAQVVPQFVQAMQSLDYPPDRLQILFLTETDDSATRNAIRALDLPPHFEIVVVPDGKPRTKPRACNYGLMLAKGPYVVIYDAEDVPDPLQLKKAVLTFANHSTDVVCVQAKLNFYNIRQNILTRWFTAEYSTWFDMILPGLQLAGFSLPLGGTSNHFRTASLRALGGWDAYNVTEDCDLGLRLKRYRMNTVILDSTT